MKLAHCRWPDITRYLERSQGIIIPIGSMEQHGPTGLIGTDAICASAIAAGAGEAADALVGPTIELTVAQFNLGFPGTVSVRAWVVQSVIGDYVRSLRRHGFRRVYFVNGHGANVAVANAAFQDIYSERSMSPLPEAVPEVRCLLRSWWDHEGVDALRRMLYGDAEGMHATPSEVAITRHVVPESAAHDQSLAPLAPLTPEFFRDHGGDRHFDAHEHASTYPDGRVGSDPSLASREDGERLLNAAIDAAAKDYERFIGS